MHTFVTVGYDELNEIKYLTLSLHWLRRKIRYAYKIDVYVVRSARLKALLSKDFRSLKRQIMCKIIQI